MKLAWKLAIALFVGMSGVLVAHAGFWLQYDVLIIDKDLRRDHAVLGQAVGASVENAWRLGGAAAVEELLERVNAASDHIRIRRIWLEAPADSPDGPRLGPERLKTLQAGAGALSEREQGRLYTYIPVKLAGQSTAALELDESLDDERHQVQTAVWKILTVTGGVGLTLGLLTIVLGIWFIGRPTRRLIERARRAGAGDLSSRLSLRQKDELGELAGELDAMCGRIAAANEKAAAESAARLATLEQLKHADRLATVGKLASGVAHELGTPLNVVWARAKMIAAEKPGGEESKANASIIAQQAENMTRIIRQLLDFSRPRAPHMVSVDLWHIVRQTIALLGPMAEKRRVAFELRGAGEPALAEVDPDQVQQVMTNLAVNGIQAMPGGGKLGIRIVAERALPPAALGGAEGEYSRIDIEDEGTGISEEVKAHLFEPFFTTKPVGEGTGLGLSVSHGIVQEHRGWIGVASEVGKGTCFSIFLPRR